MVRSWERSIASLNWFILIPRHLSDFQVPGSYIQMKKQLKRCHNDQCLELERSWRQSIQNNESISGSNAWLFWKNFQSICSQKLGKAIRRFSNCFNPYKHRWSWLLRSQPYSNLELNNYWVKDKLLILKDSLLSEVRYLTSLSSWALSVGWIRFWIEETWYEDFEVILFSAQTSILGEFVRLTANAQLSNVCRLERLPDSP